MADPDLVQPSDSAAGFADLWAVDPNATPVSPAAPPASGTAPPPAAAPSPTPAVVPNQRPQISESALWGTEALDTTQTPVTQQPAQTTVQPAKGPLWNDDDELKLADQDRQKALGQVVGDDDVVLTDPDRKKHPLYNNTVIAEQKIKEKPLGKTRTYYEKELAKLNARIDKEIKEQAAAAQKKRAENLKEQNEPYQSIEQREKNVGIVGGHVQTIADERKADMTVGTPEEQAQKEYNYRTSPLTTMAGNKKKDADGNETYDYRPLKLAAGSLASLNKNVPAEVAADIIVSMGSPVGGTNDKGEPVKGFNGRSGAGAASYKVLGKDESGMVRVKLADGRTVRIDPYSLDQVEKARVKGWKVERTAWEKEQAKKAEEAKRGGFGTRVLRAIIPGKGT